MKIRKEFWYINFGLLLIALDIHLFKTSKIFCMVAKILLNAEQSYLIESKMDSISSIKITIFFPFDLK